jgi:hypothetical protein
MEWVLTNKKLSAERKRRKKSTDGQLDPVLGLVCLPSSNLVNSNPPQTLFIFLFYLYPLYLYRKFFQKAPRHYENYLSTFSSSQCSKQNKTSCRQDPPPPASPTSRILLRLSLIIRKPISRILNMSPATYRQTQPTQ